MNLKRLLPFAFIISFFGAGLGYVFNKSLEFGICICTAYACNPACLNFYDRIGVPMLYGFAALALIFLVLWLVPKTIPAWEKFARWYIPLAALLFIFYPTHQSLDFISPSLGIVCQWVSGMYVAISLVIILVASLKKKVTV
jgi:hypothetical protein